MKTRIAILSILFLTLSFTAGAQEGKQDFSKIDNIISTLYDVISGPAQERDWDLFRTLFSENALMGHTIFTPAGERGFTFFTPEEYIDTNDPFFKTHSFYEKELGRETNIYGGLAQVLSAYEFELEDQGQKITQRGVNSIHLVFDKGRWYVSQLLFEPETPGNPIPPLLSGDSHNTGISEVTRVYFVRHVEKKEDGTQDPDITVAGKASARKLAVFLADKEVEQVYSTPYKRTRNTAQPVAEIIGKKTRIYDPRDPNALMEMIRNNQGKAILVVGHSNTVPMMINQLAKEMLVQPLSEDQYNELFLVEYSDDHFKLERLNF